jgi:Nucleotidyl transferase AbiEii toxin, Type IV TA system
MTFAPICAPCVRIFCARAVIHSAFVRFPGLLFELGLSPHRNEQLAIKIEVDTRPPAGAGLATTLIRRHVTMQLQHHDKASLLAGKLHAILARPYTKGRDLFDLIWYLSDPSWPSPNLDLLNHALAQTAWPGPPLTLNTWRQAVRQRLQELDWQRAVADVRPFLEAPASSDLVTLEHVLAVLG